MTTTKTYDVVICGSGLAGLTLARQLKMTLPNLNILTLDKLSRPLPEATFKVGESSVEVGAYYLSDVIQLKEYIETQHFLKLGLRYFFGNSQDEFHRRWEFGLSRYHEPNSYQLDRGKFENDLREFNLDMGIEILENCQIKDIKLSENPEENHEVIYVNSETQTLNKVRSRWVIDSLGRRRILQRKLGLDNPNSNLFNAVWFRVEGRFDLSDFVPETETQWHERVPNKNRYYSTNHLCGKGYWVWLIPLSTGHTSVGIVAKETLQPFASFHTYEKAMQWLQDNEPIVARHLEGKNPEDFMKMPRYSYTSRQVFSMDCWACVGEAGMFPDPFYSPGLDMIGFGNSIITQMIEQDQAGQLTAETVKQANNFYLAYHQSVRSSIQNMYNCFGNGLVGASKIIWDTLAAWAFSAPLMFNGIFLDHQKRNRIYKGSGKFFLLTTRVQTLFREWAEKSLNRGSFEFINYLDVLPFMSQLRDRNLRSHKTEPEMCADHLANLALFEEMTQVFFLYAVADTMPEQLDRVLDQGWLNAWAVSLNPENWEKDGLFNPQSPPRNLSHVIEPLNQVFHLPEPIMTRLAHSNQQLVKDSLTEKIPAIA